MPEDNDTPAPSSASPIPGAAIVEAQPHDPITEALIDAYAKEFELFAAQPEARRAVRESIAGKVKRRTLMRLGFAQGCKTGNMAADYMARAQLARAVGIDGDLAEDLPRWSDLLASVRRIAGTGSCVEPDCRDGYVHEDGEVSLCWACSRSKEDQP